MWSPQALTARAIAAAEVRMSVVRNMAGTLFPVPRRNHAARPRARWGYPPSRAERLGLRHAAGDRQPAVRALLPSLLRPRPRQGRAGPAQGDARRGDGSG